MLKKMARSILLTSLLIIMIGAFRSPFGVAQKIEHQPILIDSDNDFVSSQFPGTGTKEDPYIIEDYKITSTGSMTNAIEVKSTSKYFIIRNCQITASYIGILVEGVSAGTASVINNTIASSTNKGGGIVLGANGVLVSNNTCTNFVEGIHTNYASDCIIRYNNFSNNHYHGISLRYSSNNVVTNNTVMNNEGYGVLIIRESALNKVFNNTIIDNAKLESYNWDDIYTFQLNHQALDAGSNNIWYDAENKRGNVWSDYSGTGEYVIDGSAHAVDKYPQKGQSTSPATEPPQESGNTQTGVSGFMAESIMIGAITAIAISLLVQRSRTMTRTHPLP